MEEVWRLRDFNGEGLVKLRRGSPVRGAGKVQAGESSRFCFHFFTTEDASGRPVGMREVKVDLELRLEGSTQPERVTKIVHCRNSLETFDFALKKGQSASWAVKASSAVLLVRMNFAAVLFRNPDGMQLTGGTHEEEQPMSLAERLTLEEKKLLAKAMEGWPDPSEFTELTYPRAKGIEEMERWSRWKVIAHEKGLIRPFLLFVSMPPCNRLEWAFALNIHFIHKSYYPNPHREALKILTRTRFGIQSRASHAFTESMWPLSPNANWYQIVHRVCRHVAKDEEGEKDLLRELEEIWKSHEDSLSCCQRPFDSEMLRLEEMLSALLFKVAIENVRTQNKEVYDNICEMMNQADEGRLQRLHQAGYLDDELCRYIIATTQMLEDLGQLPDGMREWASSKGENMMGKKVAIGIPITMIGLQLALGFVSPLTLIPIFMLARNTTAYALKETPGRLLSPLVAILQQKNSLALRNIRVDLFIDPF